MKNTKSRRRQRKRQTTVNVDVRPKYYEEIVRKNEDFETYYKLQNICKAEEWDDFMSALKSDLPTSFRITGSRSESKALLKIVQGQYFKDYVNAQKEKGDILIEPVALPWYPDSLAWQLQLTRKEIRREGLLKLHNFLMSETESGNISRQETVSMIPPIVLDVQSHHKILDMCASPGSKTAQIIECLHKNERLPEGFVIANDIDNKRCYMLVHQAKRLNSPNIIITNHDASLMPNFIVKAKDGGEGVLKFDRILCDVPCSGDGTLRKNPDIWTKWNAANAPNLHGVQYRILKRGCEMLAVGGRIVYSTCSLNPIENEAVIMRLLGETKGAMKLVDVSSSLIGLKYKKGLSSWTPTTRDLVAYKSFAEVPEKWHNVIRPQFFPPSEEDALKHNLDRCIRVLPHYQNTGGFFVAVLEKTNTLPWESAESTAVKEIPKEGEKLEPSRKKRRVFGYKEDPYVFFDDNEPLWQEIRDFYDISDDLPRNCLLRRGYEGKKKIIYFTSPKVREIIVTNADRIKIINSGVKAFARTQSNKEMKCEFRLVHEGLSSIVSFIGPKRKVNVTQSDLLILLSHEDMTRPPEITKLNPKTQEKINEIGFGSCVLVYAEEPVTEDSLHFELSGWIGSMSVRAYIPSSDVIHFLRLIGGDTSKFDVSRFAKNKNEEQEIEKSEDSDTAENIHKE